MKTDSLNTDLLITLPLALLLAASNVTAAPAAKPALTKPRIEVCFVLDTTGSMGGLIEGAKQKIWSIANEMISAKPTPELKLGLVGYRDRGDDYVTKHFDLTADIDAIYGELQKFQANGGGDTPESVNEALADAVRKLSWSQDRSVLKIIFLVGDAPPHMDYGGPKYSDLCQEAVKKDILINTVQCGRIAETTPFWQEIAKLAEGSYVAIAQSGNMTVVETPLDKELAKLNRELGGTFIAYGREPQRRAFFAKQAASEAAPAAVAADRLRYGARLGGIASTGGGELIDALNAGAVKLETVKKEELPPELRKLGEGELKAQVERQQKVRADLQARVTELNKRRDAWLAEERQRLAAKGKADAFDGKVTEMIHTQAAKKGIRYGK